jgi:hypothetical protein
MKIRFMYVVTCIRWKTSETTVMAVFRNHNLANIYVRTYSTIHGTPRVVLGITKVPVMDGTPEMNKIVLESKTTV